MSGSWYVDESRRNPAYLIAAVSPQTGSNAALRARTRSLPSAGTVRVHMANEGARERRRIVGAVVALPVDAVVVVSRRGRGDSVRTTRDRCLRGLVAVLIAKGLDDVTLESCDEDAADRRVVRDALIGHDRRDVDYRHDSPTADCLLWLPDVVAWAHGVGGQFRRQVAPIVRAVVTV